MFQDIQAFQHLQNLHSGVGFHIPHANHKDWLNKEHHCYPSHHWWVVIRCWQRTRNFSVVEIERPLISAVTSAETEANMNRYRPWAGSQGDGYQPYDDQLFWDHG
jgi:hypothetical protein